MADKLSRLIETEAQLDEMLEEARRGASALVEEARAEAEESLRQFEMEIGGADERLRAQLDSEKNEKMAALRAEAARRVDALDKLQDDEISELARHVIARLIGDDEGATP